MNSTNLISIAPYITLIAGIIVAYLTYKNQLRLKSFELFLKRREDVLSDIEKEIKKLQDIMVELDSDGEKPTMERFKKEYFHNGSILYHKMKGANLKKILVESYWNVLTKEMFNKKGTQEEFKDWIKTLLNSLSTIYGVGHSDLNSEIEIITFPWYIRLIKKSKMFYAKRKNKVQTSKNK